MSPPPSEPALQFDNVQQLLENALVDAGVVGIDESIDQPYINRAFTEINWLLAQWATKRNLAYRIQDYGFPCTGAQSYFVGLDQTVNINPRPNRLEYAFLRFLNPSQTPVDIQLEIIPSHEDYSRILVKTIGTIAWRIFYDPKWPVGELFPWPIPQATGYALHVGFRVVLPRFQTLQQKINFPPEYEAALNWCLVRRLRVSYQMAADPTIDSLARDALNSIRLANSAFPTLRMPQGLRTRTRAYSYQGDV